MKNKLFLICFFLFSFSIVKAQENTFIIDKEMNDVIGLVGDFQNFVSKDGMSDAAKGDDSFFTSITISKEEYNATKDGNYLKVKYKNPTTTAVIISSVWDITLNKIAGGKTKVTAILAKVLAIGDAKGNLDINKTISSGKFEQQLQEFLNKNVHDEEGAENSDHKSTYSSDGF